MSEAFQNIIARTEGRVGVVQINRPKTLNALNRPTMLELNEALQSFDQDEGVGCLVVTGNERAFAAGADIKEMATETVVNRLRAQTLDLWDRVSAIKKPTIAAVSGWCLGGGNELAIACDLIVAAESAKFGQPEINIGVIPGAGATQRLARVLGKAVTMEMVLNGRYLSANEALQYGLVNRVVPTDRYLDEAISLASEIAERAPWAVRMGKAAVNKAYETTLAEGLHVERNLFNMLFATEDQKEGMAAFLEKRQAEWQGK